MEKNAIEDFKEVFKKETGKDVKIKTIEKTGEDHKPTIFVEIEMPDGDIYSASGKTKEEAENKLVKEYLNEIMWVIETL